jgi:hypothetical protein
VAVQMVMTRRVASWVLAVTPPIKPVIRTRRCVAVKRLRTMLGQWTLLLLMDQLNNNLVHEWRASPLFHLR